MSSTCCAISCYLFVLTTSPASEQVCLDDALDAFEHNQRLSKSQFKVGVPHLFSVILAHITHCNILYLLIAGHFMSNGVERPHTHLEIPKKDFILRISSSAPRVQPQRKQGQSGTEPARFQGQESRLPELRPTQRLAHYGWHFGTSSDAHRNTPPSHDSLSIALL